MKNNYGVLLLIFCLFIAGCATTENNTDSEDRDQDIETGSDDNPSVSSGVERILPKQELSPGETMAVKLDIRVSDQQSYYIVEENIPEGFDRVDDTSKTIKLIDIQDAKSEEFEYVVKAPSEPGTYTFRGQYALEGMKDPEDILGEKTVVVK